MISIEYTSDPLFYITGKDAENFSLKTGNLIGYVKSGGYSLKIGSRFGDDFLKYIIADADGFLELDNQGGESHTDGYEWLLAYLWNIKLKRAYRLGLPKQYVTKREQLSNVKGKIDVVDFFQNNTSGKYLCTYRQHSHKSIANALFIKAYQAIKDFSFCHSTRNIYNALLIVNEGSQYTHQALMQTPYFTNPFYNDYNVLIDMSKKVINQIGANFDSVHDAKAFLFDISMLFEYFIRKLLIRNNISLRSKSERKYQIPTGIENFKRSLEPDIVFERDGGMYVFDVKYKSFDFINGVNREDLFQLHTYIGQYGNDACIKGCGFIYPISEARWGEVQNQINTSNPPVIMQHGKAIPFHVLFLKIPNNSSGNFNQKMNEECRNFMNSFDLNVLNLRAGSFTNTSSVNL